MQDKQKPRRDYLVEVLRFWACVIVACHHFFCLFLPRAEFATEKSWIIPNCAGYNLCTDLYKSPLFEMFSAGTFAVALFFILSGYILSKPYFAKTELSWSSLFGDIFKRYVRLGFPLYVAGVVSLICSKVGWYEKYGVTMGLVAGSGWGTAFFPRATIADYDWLNILWAPYAFVQNVVPPTWTIQTELIGSYLTYALVALIHSSSLALGIGIISFFCSPDYYKEFVFGILYAYLEHHTSNRVKLRWKRFKRFRLFPMIGFLLIVLGLWMASYPGNNLPVQDLVGTIWEWLTPAQVFLQSVFRLSPGIALVGATLLFVVCKLWISESRVVRWLAPLGKYTYVIYLAHFILLGTVVSWFHLHLKSAGSLYKYDPLQAVIITFFFYVFVLILCCFLEPLIDGNAIGWSHRLKTFYLRSLPDYLQHPQGPQPSNAPQSSNVPHAAPQPLQAEPMKTDT